MSLLSWNRIYRGSTFEGPTCPTPTVLNPNGAAKPRGCCLPAHLSANGKQHCCAPANTHVCQEGTGKYSLNCKGPCKGNNPSDNQSKSGSAFKVVSVSGNTLTADRSVSANCKSSQQAELRRPGASGADEFGGDIVSISGNKVTFTGSVKRPPRVGDNFIAYCANTGGSSIGDSFDFGDSLGFDGGIPSWVFLAGGGVVLYMLLSKGGSK